MASPFRRADPVFDRRAFMLDISRDRVPTGETLEWLVGVLAALGYNELQLYTEHTFAYTGHEVVWRDASPMTHPEMRRLDSLCDRHGLDLVANMNCFGHMGRWLAHEEYRGRAEAPDGTPAIWGEGVMPPGCLAPTEDNAAFGVGLAREMASVVRHRRIHIGGDEPFELGDGVSAAEVAVRGRDHVYLEHLRRIIEPLAADGHEVMFWADLFRRDPSLMSELPDGAVGVVWNYEAPGDASWAALLGAELLDRLGLPDDAHLGFAAHARLFIESGTPFWVAPGTGTWNTIIGRNLNAAANIADAAAVGTAHGARGMLLTDWGDNGHWQPLPVSLPSMVRGGFAAWDGEVPEASVVAGLVDEVAGFDPGVGAMLDRLGSLGEDLGLACLNGTPLFWVLQVDGRGPVGEPDPHGFERAAAVLEEARDRFGSVSVGGPRGEIVAEEMRAAVALADLGLRRLLDDPPGSADLDAAAAAQRAAWLRSSRPGGLDDSIAKLRR